MSNKVIDAVIIPVSPEILGNYKLVVTCKVDEWSVNYLIKLYDFNFDIVNNFEGTPELSYKLSERQDFSVSSL